MILENKHRGNGKAVYKEALPSYPQMTKDGTKPYLAKLVKSLVKDYKGNRNWTYRSQRFSSEVILTKDCVVGTRARDMQRR